jgi:hypothetical protein
MDSLQTNAADSFSTNKKHFELFQVLVHTRRCLGNMQDFMVYSV